MSQFHIILITSSTHPFGYHMYHIISFLAIWLVKSLVICSSYESPIQISQNIYMEQCLSGETGTGLGTVLISRRSGLVSWRGLFESMNPLLYTICLKRFTHGGLMMSYCEINYGQHWFSAWQHQTITWHNINTFHTNILQNIVRRVLLAIIHFQMF